ncbi:MAG: P-II family nitrogen regulator [Chloroflexi bacterium]|nr:P-II family nitrogen regulator [Chloroflexota bacterium]
MIKIEAIVRPERVNLVIAALEDAGCTGYHLFNITGAGQQRGVEVFTGRGAGTVVRTALPKTLISTVIPDDMKDSVIEAIVGAARSAGDGAIGDGKIFISKMDEVVRVRTGESGDIAL